MVDFIRLGRIDDRQCKLGVEHIIFRTKRETREKQNGAII